jgi:predicted nucleic acid-binding protein
MMKKKVYIETSIASYLTARPNRDLVIAARQEITHELWQVLQKQYEIYISALVIQEASRGDENAAKKRLSVLANIPVLEISPDAQALARVLIADNAIPSGYEEDALHIAIASTSGIDVLLTWNFSHINNAFTKTKIIKSVEHHGYEPPIICSPEELLGD